LDTNPKNIKEFDGVSEGSAQEPESEAPPLGSDRRVTASWPPSSKQLGTSSPRTVEIRNPSGVTSFGSGGCDATSTYGSFDSTVTDFDYLTCPGAQAEMSSEYMAAVRRFHHGNCEGLSVDEPSSERGPVLEPASSVGASFGVLPHAQLHGVGAFTGRTGLPQGNGAAPHCQVQVAQYEFLAAQLMAQAYQAKANALRMQGGGANDAPTPNPASTAFMQEPFSMQATAQASQGPSSFSPLQEQRPPVEKKRSVSKFASNKDSARTTIMLRNLPNDYTRDMVLELLDEQGFVQCYNFIYLPMDMKRKAGLGYAFINMVSPSDAARAFGVLQGFSEWKKFSSSKVLEVAWGDPLQGLQAHVDRYKNSPVMHPDVPDEFRPMLFKDGKRIDFPPPTRKIREPRIDFRG